MYTFPRFNLSIALMGIMLLCTGCGKKRPKTILPPLKKTHFEAQKNGVTLKLKELNEHELKEINSKGLGSYKIGRVPFNKKQNRRARNKYVRVLYGTLINESTHPISINRRSVSLPILPLHKAYGFSNSLMIWGFLGGVFGLACAATSIALLASGPGGGIMCAGGNFVVLAAGPNFNLLNGLLLMTLGLEFTIAGFAVGAREVSKEKNLKHFARDTMLADAYREVQPESTQSWLMVVRSHKYTPHFTLSCNTAGGTPLDFYVHMPEQEAF